MENTQVQHLILTVETKKKKGISSDIIQSIRSLKDFISKESGLKLTLAFDNKVIGNENNFTEDDSADFNSFTRNRTTELSPKNWDYWQV